MTDPKTTMPSDNSLFARGRAPSQAQFRALSVTFFALAFVPVAGLVATNGDPRVAFTMTSAAITLIGALLFYRSGAATITASGIYFLAIAVFGGLGGLIMSFFDRFVVDYHAFVATISIYVITVATHFFLSLASSQGTERPISRLHPSAPRSTGGLWIGPALVVVSVVLARVGAPLGPLLQELAHCGVLLTAGAMLLPTRSGTFMLRQPGYAGLVLVALFAYLSQFFSGFGRLSIATMLLSVTILYALSRPQRSTNTVKLIVLGSVLPLLVVGALVGASRSPFSNTGDRPTYSLDPDHGLFSDGRGFDSVASPLLRFSDLIRIDASKAPGSEQIGVAKGSTFAVALVAWVPRSWWPDKPVGFGSVLAEMLTPYAPYGHSEAAMTFGEWYYNFGLWGLAGAVVVHVAFLRLLDRSLRSRTRRGFSSMGDVTRALVPIVLVSGLADYVWVGAFTYSSRAGTRALILLALAILWSPSRRLRHRGVPSAIDRAVQGGPSNSVRAMA